MVIQRWQSVYLLVAALLIGFYAFMPIVGFSVDGNSFELSLLGVDSLSAVGDTENSILSEVPAVLTWPLFALAVLTSLLSLVTIFKFKQMKLQKSLCRVCIILTIALIASLLIMVSGWVNVRYYFSNCMPILAIIAYVMALRGIINDYKKISDSDRLR